MTESSSSEHTEHRRSPVNRMRAVLTVLVTLLLAMVIFSSLPPTDKAAVATTTAPTTTTTSPINKADVRVQVYNGTAVNGAAAKVTHDLTVSGWATLPAEQDNVTTTSTFVAYAPTYRPAALEVARELGLTVSAVEPLTDQTANPPPAAGTNLAVVVGLDLAS